MRKRKTSQCQEIQATAIGKSSAARRWVETVEGEKRSAWRGHHANVAMWRDDRGGTMWKYEYEDDSAAGMKAMQMQKKKPAADSSSMVGSESVGEAGSKVGMQRPTVVDGSCSAAQRLQRL